MHIQRDLWRHTMTQHWPLTSCIFSGTSVVTSLEGCNVMLRRGPAVCRSSNFDFKSINCFSTSCIFGTLASCIFNATSDFTQWPNIDLWPHVFSAGPLSSHPLRDVTPCCEEAPLSVDLRNSISCIKASCRSSKFDFRLWTSFSIAINAFRYAIDAFSLRKWRISLRNWRIFGSIDAWLPTSFIIQSSQEPKNCFPR